MSCFLSSFHLDIDPVSIIPAQPQVVMLGDKVEWQCKTKASAAHTVQWKKVCASASSVLPRQSFHGIKKKKKLTSPRMENFLSSVLPEHSEIIAAKTSNTCSERVQPCAHPCLLYSGIFFPFAQLRRSRFTALDRMECVKATPINAQLSFDTAARGLWPALC